MMVLASLGPVNLHLSCVEICKGRPARLLLFDRLLADAGLQTDSTSRLFWVVAPKDRSAKHETGSASLPDRSR